MYERSASILERYFDKFFGFYSNSNLKTNYENYKSLVGEIKKYQVVATEEEILIKEFDEIAKKIESIQKAQEKLYNSNEKLEKERNTIFTELDEKPDKLKEKLIKIYEKLHSNNECIKELGIAFVDILDNFIQKQKERNKAAKARRINENSYIETVNRLNEEIQEINTEDIKRLKEFLQDDKSNIKQELTAIMIKNGKNEKIGFNKGVVEKAVDERLKIAEKEADCYLLAYDRLKKLLAEIETDSIKMAKYEKALRDVSVKLIFLSAEKDYLASFLDYERLTAINGQKRHDKLMKEACDNFDLDIKQINNLYELILREIANKGTKKIYKELYNKTYLKEIEEKEKNFEQEATNIKLNMGTLINSNYWRIEGIKNIYNVFQDEVSEKFEKDLSEYRIEESSEETKEDRMTEEKDDNRLRNKRFIDEDIDEDFEEDEELEEDNIGEYEDEIEDDIDYDDEYENEAYDEEDDEDYIDFDDDEEDDDFEDEDEEDEDYDEDEEYNNEDEDIEYEDDYDDLDYEDDEELENDEKYEEDEELEDEFYDNNDSNDGDEFVEDDWERSDFDTRLNKIKNKWLEDDIETKKRKSDKKKKEKSNQKDEEEKEGIWGSLFKDSKKKATKKEAKL